MPSVSDRVTEATRTLTEAEILEVDRTNWPWVPNFKSTRSGQVLALSILTAASNDGCALSIECPHRTL